MNETNKPNPGTKEAIESGCTCPVIDNHYGKGYQGSGEFIYNIDCPIHNATDKDVIELSNGDYIHLSETNKDKDTDGLYDRLNKIALRDSGIHEIEIPKPPISETNKPVDDWEKKIREQLQSNKLIYDHVIRNPIAISEKMRGVIEMRLQGKTLEEVGKAFGVTRERIRQIEAKVADQNRFTDVIIDFIRETSEQAYQKGRFEGYKDGYAKGYSDCEDEE